MEKFVFNNDKAVVVNNVNSITRREELSDNPEIGISYFIDILYLSGVTESVYYGNEVSLMDIDFGSFANS